MVKIDRMEIDDAGSDPKTLAKAIIKQLPKGTVKTPVREIAEAIDIYEIREERLSGLEGALIVPQSKSIGAILINSDRHETRKRYTIAHELGHYVHPFHRGNSHDGFRCRSKDLAVEKARPNDRHALMEQQANEFAAELLMPTSSVENFIHSSGNADLEHILELANRHEVSREAAARRYIPRVEEPAAIVFSNDGVIRYARCNDLFPKLSITRGDKIPPFTSSADSVAEIGEVTDWAEVDSSIWLADDDGVFLFEQTLAQHNGFRMTLLTVELNNTDVDWDTPVFYNVR